MGFRPPPQLADLEGTSFDYDDNGNQTPRGSDTFEYDHEGRLTEVTYLAPRATPITYDAGDRLTRDTGAYTYEVFGTVRAQTGS